MPYSGEKYAALFDTTPNAMPEKGWSAGVIHQRVRTIKAGPMVYVECFPIWDTQKRASDAKSLLQIEKHREAVRAQNEKNAQKKLLRIVNANFGKRDIGMTCEYGHGKQPKDEKEAARDAVNFLNRVKRLWGKISFLEMKYVYITEKTNSKKYGERYHHHILMSGDGMDRDMLEELWTGKHGGICNTIRYQRQERHWSGFAAYLLVDKTSRGQEKAMGRRRWKSSKNLFDPIDSARVADKKISIRRAGQIAANMGRDAKEIFEKLYPNHTMLECEAKTSKWVTGVYVYAVLRSEEDTQREGRRKPWTGEGRKERKARSKKP